jgi:glycerol-3-phosphate dehydrogenase
MIPWYGRVVVGTTDTPISEPTAEPRPKAGEVDFLLETSARYLIRDPLRSDVRGVFTGIRPLVKGGGDEASAALSREHTVSVSKSGLVTIAGGKWTTYRKMAEDTVDCAATVGGLAERPCRTQELRIHGYDEQAAEHRNLAVYGSDAPALRDLIAGDSRLAEPLHPSFSHRAGEVVWAVRHEMARSVTDVLARRTRVLLLDTRASIEMAPAVAELMARELGRDGGWIRDQVRAFRALAESQLLA